MGIDFENDDIYEDPSEVAFQRFRNESLAYMKEREEALIKQWLDKIGFTEPVGYYLSLVESTIELYTTRPGSLVGHFGVYAEELKKMLSDEFITRRDWKVNIFEIRGGIINTESLTVNSKRIREEVTKKNIKTVEVSSASRKHLTYGIISILLIIAIEIGCIYGYMTRPMTEAIPFMFTMQIIVLFLAAMSATTISAWKHKSKFNLYFCRLSQDIDIGYIKKNYSIQEIDEYAVLFIDKQDIHKYMDWNLFQDHNTLYSVEVDLFK